MAVSAFKSTSKRGNLAASCGGGGSSSSRPYQAEDAGKKSPGRRSRSVSAVSRSYREAPAEPSTAEFLNKRDNPLFCTSSTSPTDSEKSMVTAEGGSNDGDGRRGRSVSRSSGFRGQFSGGPRKEWGRSLSRADTGRGRRSVSRGHFGNSESFQSDHPLSDAGGGIYETVRSEVRRAVSEIQNDLENAIRRKNSTVITLANSSDISPDLVNPDAIELVSDIRREYTVKLDQSQERARKLREELDIEEQRGQELSRILKEILPDPKFSEIQKSRSKQKTSIERRKMSRRLAEEATNYFDECVSISTFDSSDFSSPEDPLPTSVGVTPLASSIKFPTNGNSNSSTTFIPNGSLHHQEGLASQDQHSICHVGLDFTGSGSFNQQENINQDNVVAFDTLQSGNRQFSFTCEPKETLEAHDTRHYIKKFGRGLQKDGTKHANVRSSYNFDDYDSTTSAESLLFEKLILRNRVDYGGLLVCDVRIF